MISPSSSIATLSTGGPPIRSSDLSRPQDSLAILKSKPSSRPIKIRVSGHEFPSPARKLSSASLVNVATRHVVSPSGPINAPCIRSSASLCLSLRFPFGSVIWASTCGPVITLLKNFLCGRSAVSGVWGGTSAWANFSIRGSSSVQPGQLMTTNWSPKNCSRNQSSSRVSSNPSGSHAFTSFLLFSRAIRAPRSTIGSKKIATSNNKKAFLVKNAGFCITIPTVPKQTAL